MRGDNYLVIDKLNNDEKTHKMIMVISDEKPNYSLMIGLIRVSLKISLHCTISILRPYEFDYYGTYSVIQDIKYDLQICEKIIRKFKEKYDVNVKFNSIKTYNSDSKMRHSRVFQNRALKKQINYLLKDDNVGYNLTLENFGIIESLQPIKSGTFQLMIHFKYSQINTVSCYKFLLTTFVFTKPIFET